MRSSFAERTQQLANVNASLDRMKNRRRLTIESAPNAILMVDEQVQIVLVNTQTETRFGDDREGLLGQPLELLPNSSGLSIPTGSSATKA